MLNDKSSFIEPSNFEVEDLLADFKLFDGFTVSIDHHETAANIIMDNGVFYGLLLKIASSYFLGFDKTSHRVFVLFKMIKARTESQEDKRFEKSFVCRETIRKF